MSPTIAVSTRSAMRRIALSIILLPLSASGESVQGHGNTREEAKTEAVQGADDYCAVVTGYAAFAKVAETRCLQVDKNAWVCTISYHCVERSQ